MDETVEVRDYRQKKTARSRYNCFFWVAVALVGIAVIGITIWAFWARDNHEKETTDGTKTNSLQSHYACVSNAINRTIQQQYQDGLATLARRHFNLHHMAWVTHCDFWNYFNTEFGDVSTRPLDLNHDYRTAQALGKTIQFVVQQYEACNISRRSLLLSGVRADLARVEYYLNLTQLDWFLPQFMSLPYAWPHGYWADRVSVAAETLDTLLEDPIKGRCNGKISGWRAVNASMFETLIVQWAERLVPALSDWKRGFERQETLHKTHSSVQMEEQRDFMEDAADRDYSQLCALITNNDTLRARCNSATALVNDNMLLFREFFVNIYIWTAAAHRPINNDTLAVAPDGHAALHVLNAYKFTTVQPIPNNNEASVDTAEL